MKTLILALAFPLATPAALADGPCANFAKAKAIAAYHAEMGTVQGSEGIQYEATLISERGSNLSYLVTIADNNEDGDTWEVDYQVVVNSQAGCKVTSFKKIATR